MNEDCELLMRRTTIRDAVRLVRKHGLKIDFKASPLRRPHWDGKTIAGAIFGGKPSSASNIIHEMAHWLVAPRHWKWKENFGLGPSPSEPSQSTVAAKRWNHEEEEDASLLGIIYEASVGGGYMATLRDHNWDRSSDDALETYRRLNRRGLLKTKALQRGAEMVMTALSRVRP